MLTSNRSKDDEIKGYMQVRLYIKSQISGSSLTPKYLGEIG